MIDKVVMYRVLCDRCGASAQDGGEYAAWSEADQAEWEAGESNWDIEGGNHLCWDCIPPLPDDVERAA